MADGFLRVLWQERFHLGLGRFMIEERQPVRGMDVSKLQSKKRRKQSGAFSLAPVGASSAFEFLTREASF